jgi:hypothetical protein
LVALFIVDYCASFFDRAFDRPLGHLVLDPPQLYQARLGETQLGSNPPG